MRSPLFQRPGCLALLAAGCLLLAAGMLCLPAPWAHLAASLLGLVCVICVHLYVSGSQWTHPWRLTRPPHLIRHLTIHGDLLVSPRRVTEACLPFDPAPQPKLRSGAILWASAATVTHTLAAEGDRKAILAAVKPLGFTPEKFLARCPILGEVEVNGQRGYVVRDGHGFRAYFLGDPALLLEACAHVWDQQERPVTKDDLTRLPSHQPSLYGLAMAPANDDGVGPLTYLGSMQVAAPLVRTDLPGRLSDAGFQVTVTPAACAPEHTAALQALSTAPETPEHTLHVAAVAHEGNSFVVDDPQQDWASDILSGRAKSIQDYHQMLAALLAPAFLMLAGAIWQLPPWLIPLSMLLTLPRSIAFLIRSERPSALTELLLRLFAAILWCSALCLGVSRFAAYVAPAALEPGLIIAFCAFAALLSLENCGAPLKIVLSVGLIGIAAAWLLLQPPALLGAFCLLAGLLDALVLRVLLRPLECS